MQATAKVRGISMSPRKMRVVANIVRNKKVEEAVGLLDLMPKKAAGIISKAIKSAAANAEDRSGGDASVETLKVHLISVDGGTIQKRFMPRAQGRANRINHRTSHLTVVVSDEK
jgi:large subunit ribosomal protein L22